MSNEASPSSRFDEIVRDYYHAWFRYHPEAAVETGVPGYAHLLRPYNEEDKGALIYLNDELRMSLDELDRGTLTTEQQIDRDILYGAALLENQHLLEMLMRVHQQELDLLNQRYTVSDQLM